jgi:hypothetical protein
MLTSGSAFGQTGSSSSVGYIDPAIPMTMLRLRGEAADDDNRPERADFFYSKNAPGPLADHFVNYQEMYAYLEVAPTPRLSGFIELPYRFLQPDQNTDQNGLGDLDFGFKYAFLYTEDTVGTLQVRMYAPTADGLRGLGTHNWNIEPALLLYKRLTDRLTLEAELRDFIPVYAYDDFAGNVIRYGAGLGYLLYDTPKVRVLPVFETVGWTVLSGAGGTFVGDVKAAGETIVNVKIGFRIQLGEVSEPGGQSRSDLYIGYGRPVTGTFWYKDILRAEYRLHF